MPVIPPTQPTSRKRLSCRLCPRSPGTRLPEARPVPWVRSKRTSANLPRFRGKRVILMHMGPGMLSHIGEVPEEIAEDGKLVEI
jgi:hypothetical protein